MSDISDITSCTKSLLREKKRRKDDPSEYWSGQVFFSPEVVTQQFPKWIHQQVPNEVQVSNMA